MSFKDGKSKQELEAMDNNPPHSNFNVPKLSDLSEETLGMFKHMEQSYGFLPNFGRGLANFPQYLGAFMTIYGATYKDQRGTVTETEKLMIAVTISGQNRALHCLVGYQAMFRSASLDPYLADQLACDYRVADITPRQRAILDFAMLVHNVEPITEDAFKALEKSGLEREDGWAVGSVVAFIELCNRIMHLGGFRPNDQWYNQGRKLEEKDTKM